MDKLENANLVQYLFFDPLLWEEVGQILRPFAAAMGILVQAICDRYGI